MSKRLKEITQRKQALLTKAERERTELTAAYAAIRAPLTITATLYGIGRLLKAYPLVATAVSSLLVSGYTGKVVKSSGQLLRLWKLTLPIRQWWKNRSTK